MAGCCPTDEDLACCGTAPTRSQALAWMRLVFAALIAGQTMTFSLGANISPPEGSERTILHAVLAASSLAVFLLLGLPLLRESWRQALAGRVVIEQMFLLGIAGAYAASVHSSLTGEGSIYYELVAILLAIYTLGTLVMQNRRNAALRSAQSLRSQYDKCLRLDANGEAQEIAADEIKIGDRIVVYANSGIPVDGFIREGRAFIRETAMTGEPFPVVREQGDPVLAGSYVLDQKIIIESTVGGKSRKLDLLLDSIDRARDLPSKIQQEADRIITWFLPVVLVISVLTFAGWTWASGWIVGLFNALAVLVVACPCAMGLATPIGIMSALNAFARRGLVAKNGDFIEALSKIDTVVFDKTGTLSEESLQLVEFVTAAGFERDQLRTWIGALEEGNSHPIARAFHDWVGGKSALQAREIRILPGAGICGQVQDVNGENHQLAIGNAGILSQQDSANVSADSASLMTIFVTVDGVLAATVRLRERLRESSSLALGELKAMGLRVEIMSGDQPQRLRELGFPDAKAGLLPEQKAELVRELQQAGRRVLFVGDGMNDSAAMACATASIALVSGAELTREVATVQLFGENLSVIPWAKRQAGRVIRGIRGNLWFAACYNAIGILLAVSGVLHPVMAAILMTLSSATVTWRAIRFGEKLQDEAERESEGSVAQAFLSVPEVGNTQTGMSVLPCFKPWGVVWFACMVLQGLLVAYMANISPLMASLTVLGFALAGAVMAFMAESWQRRPVWLLYAAMLAVGNLGMLAGWFADAGFMRAMPSCCAMDGGMSLPLLNWMNGGMVLASLPLLFVISVQPARAAREFLNRKWIHALFCIGGMVLGMLLSMRILAISGAEGGFFLSYSAMTLGMFIGMILCCKFYFQVLLGRVKTA
jgi:heavy metal translocating P-type ATPase